MGSLTNRYCAHKWVCFDCHTSVKRHHPLFYVDAKCQHCGKGMVRLGYKIPIPKKTDTKRWAALRKQILGVKNHMPWLPDTRPKDYRLIKQTFKYN